MKEVRYWEAEDGMKFESEEDCAKYEHDCHWQELLEIVPCYTDIYTRIEANDEMDVDCVAFILIPDSDDKKFMEKFWDALHEMDDDYFYGRLPYGEANYRNDVLYFEYESDTWRVWSADKANIDQMGKKFQLFRGE